MAWAWLVVGMTASGAPAIRFVTEHGEETAGVGEPQCTVQAPRFELFRAATGRRTEAEMAALVWDPSVDVTRLVGGPFFTIRTESLRE